MGADSDDRAVQHRLDYLRRQRGERAFLTEEPTTGQDRTRAVALEVDASGWVLEARVTSLDGLRRPEEFVSAVRQAYLSASLARLVGNAEARRKDRPPTPAEEERGRAIAEGRVRLEPPPRPHLPRWELPRTPVEDRRPGPVNDAGHRTMTGCSRDAEITVSATVAAGLDDIRVDADWLGETGVDVAHYALREAFADLRTTYEHLRGKGAI